MKAAIEKVTEAQFGLIIDGEYFTPCFKESRNDSTHMYDGFYFSFPLAEIPGHKFCFVNFIEKHTAVRFIEL